MDTTLQIILSNPANLTAVVLILLTSVLGLSFWFYSSNHLPELVHVDTPFWKFIIEKCPLLGQHIEIPLYVRNTHIQTILPSILPKPVMSYERTELKLSDGGIVALDWAAPPNVNLEDTSPIVILLPGLTGDKGNFNFFCKKAIDYKYRCVVFNKRGHGNTKLTTPKLQSFGDPSDLREVVEHIRQTYPQSHILGYGSSAGSGLLASYVGEYGSSTYLTGAVFLSPGYRAEKLFNEGMSKIYEKILLWSLKRLVKQHTLILSKAVDVDSAFKVDRLSEFEDKLYRSLYGYDNMSQYWANNCPMRNFENMVIPGICISSVDDPVCMKNNIPREVFINHSNMMLVATERGGHCAFLHGQKLEPWGDKVALQFFSALLEFTKK